MRARLLRLHSFWLSVLLSLAVLGGYVLSRPELKLLPAPALLEFIEAKTLDLRVLLRGKQSPGNAIVIIAVDEKTEDELGRWQSAGRRWLAQMLDLLHEGGAKVIGFDFTLAEPDEGAAVAVVEEIKTRYAQETLPSEKTGFLTYLDELRLTHDDDRQLAEAIQRAGNVILGVYHFFNHADATHLTPDSQAASRQLLARVKYATVKFPPGTPPQPLRLRHSFGVQANLPAFSAAAKSCGHFTIEKDPDGYLRKSPLLIEYQGDYYPSLDVEVVRAALNLTAAPIIQAVAQGSGGSVDGIRLGKLYLPTDEQGHFLISYYGPAASFTYYSLADVVRRKVVPSAFQDKIVLVGFTGSVYQDLHSAPFQPGSFPGVETHATLIANMLRQDFLTRNEATTLLDACILLLLGLGLGIAFQQGRSLRWDVLNAGLSVLLSAGLGVFAFIFLKIWLNLTFPLLFIGLDYLTMASYKYFTEEKQKREIKRAFQRYVSPVVVQQMLARRDQLHLGGERKQLTAFFSDIRGFTSISETMSPEALVRFLNEYLSAMTNIVLAYDGTVDKYMGDAIMAFYGAPLPQPDHAIRACKTAVDMIIRVAELGAGWKARGLPPLSIGIGINSGEMSVGNMGSEERFDYTIMGDYVNLASRLEGINKQYGTQIVISQFTYALIRTEAFLVRELDCVRVKGKREPVTIYELIGYGSYFPQMRALADMFGHALAAYKRRQWHEAQALFRDVLQAYPADQPASHTSNAAKTINLRRRRKVGMGSSKCKRSNSFKPKKWRR